MLIDLACVAGYCVGLVVCYRRWRTLGIIAHTILVATADVARGTREWSRPHHDVFAGSRPNDWACHSLGLLPLLAVFTPAALVALSIVQRNTREGTTPAFWTQLGGVLIAFAVAAMPAVMATLEWGIMIWGCDTL